MGKRGCGGDGGGSETVDCGRRQRQGEEEDGGVHEDANSVKRPPENSNALMLSPLMDTVRWITFKIIKMKYLKNIKRNRCYWESCLIRPFSVYYSKKAHSLTISTKFNRDFLFCI